MNSVFMVVYWFDIVLIVKSVVQCMVIFMLYFMAA